jgi:hypothetical protein
MDSGQGWLWLGHATAVSRSSCTSDSTECIIEPHTYTDLYANTDPESNGYTHAYTDTNWNSYKYGDSYCHTRARLDCIQLGHADSYTEPYSID